MVLQHFVRAAKNSTKLPGVCGKRRDVATGRTSQHSHSRLQGVPVFDSESLMAFGQLLSLLALVCGGVLCFRYRDVVNPTINVEEPALQAQLLLFSRSDWHLMNRASRELLVSAEHKLAA
jgi:hypothetical protein